MFGKRGGGSHRHVSKVVQKARPALRTWEKSSHPLLRGEDNNGKVRGLGGEEGVGEAVASHKEQKSLSAFLGQIVVVAQANWVCAYA